MASVNALDVANKVQSLAQDSQSSKAKNSGGLNGLDGNAFLTLLTAQLKSQDPTSAQDPSVFVSQLSSFSQLEQLIQIRQTLQNDMVYVPGS